MIGIELWNEMQQPRFEILNWMWYLSFVTKSYAGGRTIVSACYCLEFYDIKHRRMNLGKIDFFFFFFYMRKYSFLLINFRKTPWFQPETFPAIQKEHHNLKAIFANEWAVTLQAPGTCWILNPFKLFKLARIALSSKRFMTSSPSYRKRDQPFLSSLIQWLQVRI